MKTRPIGEIFDYEDIKLEVVKKFGCEGCYFRGECKIEHIEITGPCMISERTDFESVIFEKVEE